MSKKHTIDMTNGPIIKKLLIFVFPLIVTNLLQHLYSAADNAVVGRFVGKSALAAVGATGSATSLILNLLIGLSVGANIVNANLLGAKKFQELRKSMHNSLMLALVFGLMVSAIGILISRWVMEIINCPESVIDQATLYMRIIFCGTPGTMLYNFGAGILRTHGDSKRPMYIMAVSGLVNVILNLVFVLYCNMTVDGVALATIISKYLSAGYVMYILFNPNGEYKLRFAELKIHKQESWSIIKIGLPCGLNPLVFSISNTTVQSAVNSMGDTIVAGSVASNNVTGLIYQVLAAFYSGCINFSGQCFGAVKYKRIDKVAVVSSGICIAFVALCSTVISIIPEFFIGIFNTDPDVIASGAEKLILMSWSYVIYGVSEAIMGCLRGMRETGIPSGINIFCVCFVRVFWILLLCPYFPGNQIALYACYPVSYFISVSAMLAYYINRRKKLDQTQKLSTAG